MSEATENNSTENDKEDGDPPDLLSNSLANDIVNMWEIPQIYEFLCLAKDTLHIEHLSMYEMERMLLIPRASKQLANIMTFLLSPSMSKSNLNKIPSMPYQFWTKFLLTHKVTSWYKIYQSKDCDSVKVLDAIGVEPEFWKIFPDESSISQRNFEDLSIKQRVWLLKTVCDTLMHTKKSLQEEAANKYLDGKCEKLLGRDRYGARYFYFPIFLDGDLRVYKHNLNNKILLNATPVVPKLKSQVVNARKRGRDRRKSNRWKNGNLPLKSKKRPPPRIRNDDVEYKFKIESIEEKYDPSNNDNSDNVNLDLNTVVEKVEKTEETVEDKETPEVNLNSNEIEEQDGQQLPDDVSNSSKTDDEKINDIITGTSTVVCAEKNTSIVSKSDDEKLIETKTGVGNEDKDAEIIKRDDRLKDQVGLDTWMKALPENNNHDININEIRDDDLRHSFTDPGNQIESRITPKREMENFNNILKDLSISNFQLVADSVDSLKTLVASFSARNSNPSTEPVRCEVLLIKKLKALIDQLESKALFLIESQKLAKEKLSNELKNFQDGITGESSCLEDGVRGSNEWVLGSQGCPLLSYGDPSHQDPLHHEEDGQDKDRGVKDDEVNDSDVQQEFETRRVLRARGVSSYLEQFSSDEDSSSSEGEGWAEIVDPKTGMHIGLSSQPASVKDRQADEESVNSDSDQDWELPASRKRKNKRTSAGRRLKSFQSRLQNIKVDPSITELLAISASSTSGSIKTEKHNVNIRNGPASSLNRIKIESVHSELDIKDEGPIIDNNTIANESLVNNGVQQNYVLVNSTNGPMNYVVMPNENTTVAQSPQMLSIVPQVPPMQRYYVQGPHGYFVPGSQLSQVRPSYNQSTNYPPVQPMIIQSTQQPYVTSPGNYVQYQQVGVVPPVSLYSTTGPGPLINPPLTLPAQSMKMPPRIVQNKQIVPPHQPRHPVGAVIRSTVPFRADSRPGGNPRGRVVTPRNPTGPRNVRQMKPNVTKTAIAPNKPKTTSLIVLSDSDDEIEMIITEKSDKSGPKPVQPAAKRKVSANIKKPDVTPPVTAGQSSSKGGLTPQILQRMSQGGISITPVKPRSPAKESTISATQLVVVVNETGSHYALALPNGSKLILTPEQVAQIRASNGGKLAV